MPIIPDRLLTYPQRVKRYRPLIVEVFDSHDLNPFWGLAICRKESAFRPWVVNMKDKGDIRRGGSFGLFQMSLRTARDLGFKGEPKELIDPAINTLWAARLVKQLKTSWVSLGDVASCYNSGKPLVRLSPNHPTRGYVQDVMHFAEQFLAEASVA